MRRSEAATGEVRFGDDRHFNGVKIFSSTMMTDRGRMGEEITEWMRAHPHCEVRDTVVTQSSDSAFHCVTVTLFYWEDLTKS